ncbi:hypothetical protein BDZ45DRAFT_625561 [Acephala macrosclerotiorum]|nr:hypothetical protein BDZ45DRAFT_625561 [Acephala macrosclerotiorum]
MSCLCGCYYHVASTDYYVRYQRHYLPLLNSEVHSTILSTTSRTVLRQTFTNPSTTDAIKECIYTFPLYDGVSVVSFTCRIGKKVLTGLVKEKFKAKEIFDQAVSRGETAGLLEQTLEASDVFSTKLGNIPAGQSIIVEITYVGELKHHENESIRLTIPTKIAPRYGPGPSHGFSGGGLFTTGGDNGEIKIVVDVKMPEGAFIKGVQSPSHPIAVSMGTVSTATNADPTMSKASATLSLGSAALEKDFVLIVQSKDVGIPKAILETHPTIPNHRALMATLVPKFSLPPSRSEIVFVADRSGSMQGNIEMLVSAMKVFLKSLPQGVKFNICSFGSSHSFLWPKSQTFSRETLEQATNHLKTFDANFGGTETYGAIKGTVERRLTDLPLEIILLTDGDIHRQNDLFAYVNQQVEQTKGKIRVFTLGIGNGVSHALIEGLARAGNGFAQAVQQGERLDNAVVRMLRGALSPHITDYTLEVIYEEEGDGFELIDRVTEGMKVLLTDDAKSLKSPITSPKRIISLFDNSAEPEKDAFEGLQASIFSLPTIPLPKLLQAPHKIPTLFAFSRTTVYLLMSPETIQRKPITVTLRGTSEHGPLALEIPIETLAAPAETIHQLAAKKAVQDLEEGRGWIYDAKDQHGVLVKDKYPSSFDDLVQREAVRLGEKFQIAGKWCSFVAVSANDREIAEKKQKDEESYVDIIDDGFDDELDSTDCESLDSRMISCGASSSQGTPFGNSTANSSSALPSPFVPTPRGSRFGGPNKPAKAGGLFAKASGLFGSPQKQQQQQQQQPGTTGGLFGSPQKQQQPGTTGGLFGSSPQAPGGFGMSQPSASSGGLFGSSPAIPPPPQYHLLQTQATGFHFNQAHPHSLAQATPMSSTAGPFGSTSTNYTPPSPAFGAASPAFSPTNPVMPSGTNPFRQAAQYAAGARGAQSSPERSRPSRKMKLGSPSGGASAMSSFGSTCSPPTTLPQLGTSSSRRFAMAASANVNPSPAAELADISSGPGFGSAVSPPAGPRMRLSSRSARMSASSLDFMACSAEMVIPEPNMEVVDWSSKSVVEKVLALIDLQDFDGFWPSSNTAIPKIINVDPSDSEEGKGSEQERNVWVTMLVIKFLEMKCGDEEGTWELVVEKANKWIVGLGMEGSIVDLLEKKAGVVIENSKSGEGGGW